MLDRPQGPDPLMRTGHFFFRVWRQEGDTWSWRLRIEVVETGEWGLFDSMQEALWFMRQHLNVDEDPEADRDPLPPIAVEAALSLEAPNGLERPPDPRSPLPARPSRWLRVEG